MALATGRRPVVPVLLLILLFAACAAAEPATEPSPLPSPTGAPTAGTTATPTSAPTASATVTPMAAPTATATADDGGYGGYEPPTVATPTAGAAEATVSLAQSVEHGDYLVGPNGFTLYVFAQDEPGVSNCSSGCADAWPPLTIEMGQMPTGGPGVTGDLDLIQRSRGALQVSYDGAALYYFVSDDEPGDTTGEGVGGVWSLARP